MNKDQTIALVTGIAKVIGTILTVRGATAAAAVVNSPDLIEAVAGALMTALSFYASHKYNAASPPADAPTGTKPAPMSKLIIAAFLLGALPLLHGEPTLREQQWAVVPNYDQPDFQLLQAPAESAATAAAATPTNNPTTLDKILALLGGITNIDISPYATYAPKSLPGSREHWGGGIMAVWNATQAVGLGMGLDWLGQLSLVNVNVTLQAPFHPLPSRFPTWIAAPFVLAGGEVAYSGNGSFGGNTGTVSDVGAYTRFGHFLGGNFNFGGTYGKWTIGDFEQTRYHVFLSWMYGF